MSDHQSRLTDKEQQLLVVSNREPYIHETETTVTEPVGGLTAVLDMVLQAKGGRWIAWGSGDADFSVTDEGVVSVPPSDPQYELQRIRLSDQQVNEYYYGYSNQVLWPLAHGLVSRVNVDPAFWPAYQSVNDRFVDAVCSAIGACDPTTVWFQDYHLALAPRQLREVLTTPPEITHFWHIPWPAPSVIGRGPHTRQIVNGLLGADRLGFQTNGDRKDFLQTADRLFPKATVDYQSKTISHQDHDTDVYASPIGIDIDKVRQRIDTDSSFVNTIDETIDPKQETICVAVDRLDYTKGIVHRLQAIEHLLETRPGLQGQVRFIQKGTVTRASIPAYARYQEQLRTEIQRINRRFEVGDWQPITYVEGELPREQVLTLLAAGDVAVVTPLADGFNLTALEYLVARGSDRPGALVLSEFAGAATALGDGFYRVNPHDIACLAENIAAAITDSPAERQRRWDRLQATASDLDIYDWLVDAGIKD